MDNLISLLNGLFSSCNVIKFFTIVILFGPCLLLILALFRAFMGGFASEARAWLGFTLMQVNDLILDPLKDAFLPCVHIFEGIQMIIRGFGLLFGLIVFINLLSRMNFFYALFFMLFSIFIAEAIKDYIVSALLSDYIKALSPFFDCWCS